MTPEQNKRWKELRSMPHEARTSDEYRQEYEKLYEPKRAEVRSKIPVPNCCEDIIKYPSITFGLFPIWNEDTHTLSGRWDLARNNEAYYLKAKGDREYYNNIPAPKFCPYCGKSLPIMVRKNPMPPNICRTIGGDYCETCGERLGECTCDPCESAFEPKP